ncbi:MAG: prolipoprotein diacylglyceryl transferase [Verrucomicrobiota bacterium]
MTEYPIHDISPWLLQISGNFGIRWYGVSYVAGIVAAFYLLKWMARKRYGQMKEDEVSDFLIYAAVFGVFLGGRMGFVLFYAVPNEGIGILFRDPLMIIRVWDGGMAAHGAILGLTLYTLYYARQKGYNWPGVGDNLCTVAPLGIAFGRIANFINGELYGKPATVPWAMKFPGEMERHEIWFRVSQRLPQFAHPDQVKAALDQPEVRQVLQEVLTPRHPSQFYQAGLEGLTLFGILMFLRTRFPKLGYGMLTGAFFMGYATFRIIAEIYRDADYGSANILGLQKGQFYSLFMYAAGAAFLYYGWTRGRRAVANKR